jgi:ubiquinone/menaquinone biosynthesis C-methylase UbiE
MKKLEKMDDFFTNRTKIYDKHMLKNIDDMKEAYHQLALALPKKFEYLLDLGCGTGLEFEEIFKIYPNISVTGVDLTQAMLSEFKRKYPDKNLHLICSSYFDIDFDKNCFDVAISCQTLHHFTHEQKINLYKKIFRSLKSNGSYIECDYMAKNQNEEDFYFAENKRMREEQNILEGEFYHYDTPCTVENQIRALKSAGFKNVRKVWEGKGNTVIISAN